MIFWRGVLMVALSVCCLAWLPAQDEPTNSPSTGSSSTDAEPAGAAAAGAEAPDHAEPALHPDPPGCKRLSPEYDVWLDKEHQRVVMMGKVVLREGALELFACLKGTKEHEAIVAVPAKAMIIHAGLLAAGAQTGGPVQFLPEYKPPRGTRIDVTVHWFDPETKERKSARAQDWIRDVKTGQAMKYPFVFAGSDFWEDTEKKNRYYLAEDGDLVCVANFPSAMLDVPVQSSQSNEALMFEAFADRIPPIGTEVMVVLTVKEDEKKDATAPAADK